MKDVMLNGGSEINIIIKQLHNKLRLPKPKPSYDLNMADQLTTIKPIDLIQNMRILAWDTICSDLYHIVKHECGGCLSRSWLQDAKVSHD